MIEQTPNHPNGSCEACGGPCAVYGCTHCPECYRTATQALAAMGDHAAALRLGDWIECDVQNPSPRTLAAQLNTPEALAEGGRLLADPASGWRRATRDWSARKAPAVTATN